jgi:hypothetical protein
VVANCSCVVKALYLLVGQTVGSIVNPRMSRLREFCNIFYTLLLGGYQNSLKLFRPDLDRNKLGLNLV